MAVLTLTLLVLVGLSLAYDPCVKENKYCYKSRPIKKYSNVKSLENCSEYCGSGCNYWTWRESSYTCYTYASCKLKSRKGYFTGPKGCPPPPPPPPHSFPHSESTGPFGTSNAAPCQKSATLTNANNKVNLFTKTNSNGDFCSGIRFDASGTAGVPCGQLSNNNSSVTTTQRAPPNAQNCITNVRGIYTSNNFNFLSFSNAEGETATCGKDGSQGTNFVATPSANDFGKCCLQNYEDSFTNTEGAISILKFNWLCFGPKIETRTLEAQFGPRIQCPIPCIPNISIGFCPLGPFFSCPGRGQDITKVTTSVGPIIPFDISIRNNLTDPASFEVFFEVCAPVTGTIPAGGIEHIYRFPCRVTAIHATDLTTGNVCRAFDGPPTYSASFAIEPLYIGPFETCQVVELEP